MAIRSRAPFRSSVLLQGEVVEGSEDEIRAVVYALGLQRMYLPEKGGLVWQICELSYSGGQLYL